MAVIEVFDVKLPTEAIVQVSCPKPAQLKVLLSELQVKTGLQEEHFKVEYYNSHSGKIVQMQTQKQLDCYLQTAKKVQLCLQDLCLNDLPVFESLCDKTNVSYQPVSVSPVPKDISKALEETTTQMVKPQAQLKAILQEVFDVKLPTEDTVQVSCSKPA